jgi:hypothetical protein
MTQLEFFKNVSEHFSRNPFGPIFVIVFIFALLLIVILLMVAITNAKREKMDDEILFFLKKRHRIKEFELKALLKVAKNQNLNPEYLIMMESNIFKKYSEKIKKEILKTIKYEKQTNEIIIELNNKLFK